MQHGGVLIGDFANELCAQIISSRSLSDGPRPRMDHTTRYYGSYIERDPTQPGGVEAMNHSSAQGRENLIHLCALHSAQLELERCDNAVDVSVELESRTASRGRKAFKPKILTL